MSNSASDDWLASIDLNAVKPTGPRRATKKKPRKRVVYTTGAALAPRIPSWAQGTGPDKQRQVREVAGQFVPTAEICPANPTYEEACQMIAIIEASDHPNKARLLAVLKEKVVVHEHKLAAAEHAAAEGLEARKLHHLVSTAVDLITLED